MESHDCPIPEVTQHIIEETEESLSSEIHVLLVRDLQKVAQYGDPVCIDVCVNIGLYVCMCITVCVRANNVVLFLSPNGLVVL